MNINGGFDWIAIKSLVRVLNMLTAHFENRHPDFKVTFLVLIWQYHTLNMTENYPRLLKGNFSAYRKFCKMFRKHWIQQTAIFTFSRSFFLHTYHDQHICRFFRVNAESNNIKTAFVSPINYKFFFSILLSRSPNLETKLNLELVFNEMLWMLQEKKQRLCT